VTPRVAVISPEAVANLSPLLPGELARAATDWEWYHRCLSRLADVRYFALGDWTEVAGFDAVLVHEAIAAATPGGIVPALSQLRSRNGRLIWVEPHQRSTFAAAVFDRGFFDVVDRLVKYQLMDYAALVAALRSPENTLAAWAFYGHSSIADFYANPKLFALPTSKDTLGRHFSVDLSEHYGDTITPMMRLFTFPRPDSWYGLSPSRQERILKESQVGLALADGPSAPIRGAVAALLAQAGFDVKIHGSKVRAAATSEACVAIGPAHLDGGAADVLRFETLAVLPHDPRYVIWDDVFVPGESYLPIEEFGSLIRRGGRVLDGDVARRIAPRLAEALSDPSLRAEIMAGQRGAYERLTDAGFVAAKLGLESLVATQAQAPAAPTPEPARPATRLAAPVAGPAPSELPEPAEPVWMGAISTEEISVVIQGAISADDLPEQVVESARRHLPGCEVVLSTWYGERELTVPVDQRIESEDPGAPWQIHEEWPANTNRLLRSTAAGLTACTRPYALKLRTDTPLVGNGFLVTFQRYPERAGALRLLNDRIVVINFYCWNPALRPFGLFSVADTVNFGRTEDLREVWDRPLDEEPANSTWFESHSRPDPDRAPWAGFRYTPEQLLWLGFVRKHVHVPFEHFNDVTPTSQLLSELSIANNAIIVDRDQFGVALPKFAGREPLEPDALVSHEMWLELYKRHCLTAPTRATEAMLAEVGLVQTAEEEPKATEAPGHPLHGVDGFIVLADAEELLASEEMLRAYADTVGGPESVTLAIDASRLPVGTAEQLLVGLVERCGLHKRDDVALAAVIGPQEPRQRQRMLEAAHALYRRNEADNGDESPLPVFTPATLDRLRELVRAGGQS
jgi:WavE lipopolysaccharide synthesis